MSHRIVIYVNFASSKPVCCEAVIGLDVMHNYVSSFDFFIPLTIPGHFYSNKKFGFLLKGLVKIKNR